MEADTKHIDTEPGETGDDIPEYRHQGDSPLANIAAPTRM